ncbi:MAG TPA: Ig-like domain-containing protein, partial [Solirubrobacterales bacterium]|nr:Ig-like domain-containing protein [Solirubrobacterales bacterium]
SWIEAPAHIEVAGGEDQGAIITEPFSLPLRARVTSQSGQPVPTATVTFTLPESGPSGTFPDGSRTATATTAADGIATAPKITAGAAAGLWTATATVSGASFPARFDLEDLPAHTATGLQLAPSAPSDGAPTELVARVVTQPSAAGPAGGEVVFLLDGEPLGKPVALDASALAHLPGTELDAGKHTISVDYGGDENHAPSHTSLPVDVAPAGSEVRLTSSQNPSAAGTAVTFSGSVTAVPPTSRKPAGEAQLLVDGVETATAPLAADGSVSWPAVALGAEGEHQVETRYLGDGHFVAAGATLIQAVGADASAVTVEPSSPYARYGEPLSWAVKVSSAVAGTPSGSVTVAAGGETICDLPLVAAEAICTPAEPLAPGSHEITAAYSGDAQHAAAHGAAEQVVTAAASTVEAEVVPEATVFGQRWRLHADVAAGGGSPIAAPPTGAVRFTVDGAPLGEAVPLGADGATLAGLPAPGAGAHVVAAEYSGDARFLPGRAIAPALVSPALTEASLSSSEQGAPAGSPVSFRAALAAVPAGPVPSGQVRFLVDGRQRGATVPLQNGVAETPAWSDLAAGEHRVEAEYLGDGDFRPALATLMQRIAPAAADPGARRGSDGGPGGAAQGSRRRCGSGVTITRLRRHGRKLRLAGVADPRLEGRRVAIRLGQRRVATTSVRANGRFRATFPRPHVRHPRSARLRAVVAGIRSAPVSLRGGAKQRHGCRRPSR